MVMELLPLLVFTTCSGLAAGGALAQAIYFKRDAGNAAQANFGGKARAWVYPIVCLVLLVVGLCGTLAHLGQPMRFIYGLSNPTAMITQETYWSMALGVVLLVDAALRFKRGNGLFPIAVIGAVAGLALATVTGLAYYLSYNYEAWFALPTVPLFLLGDVALGFSLYEVLAGRRLEGNVDSIVLGVLQVCAAIAAVAFAVQAQATGADVMGVLAVGIIVGPVACAVLCFLVRAGKVNGTRIAPWVLALCVVGTVLIRAAFYAAGMF